MSIDTETLRKRLEAEKKQLEDELQSVGEVNPDNPKDWEGKPGDLEAAPGDENELADTIEEFEGNTAILKRLEQRYNEIKAAMRRMDDGTYGKCEVGGEEIEAERLEANPAARTCMIHKDKEYDPA